LEFVSSMLNNLVNTCHSLASTKVDKPKSFPVTLRGNKIIKTNHYTHKMNKVETQHKSLEHLALFLKDCTEWSIHAMSCELEHSDSTTWNVLHGYSHNLEHYIEILSFLSKVSGWESDFSRIGEMMEKAVSEGDVFVVGRMDGKSEKILEVEKVVFKGK